MRTFAPEFHLGLTAAIAACSLLLYLFDLPLHYVPLLPFLFAIACYEKREGRRIAVIAVNGVVFSLLAPELPFLFTVTLFLQLYLFVRMAFEVTTFDTMVVLFFTLLLSSVIISFDVVLYRSAFSGSFSLSDLFLSTLANFAWIALAFLFRRRALADIFTRSGWL